MPSTEEVRIVLDPSVTADVFRRGAERRSWSLVSEYPASDDNNFELIYAATKDGGTTVHYVEDHFVNVRYVLVRGPRPGPTVQLVETTVDCYDDEEIIQ